MRLEKAPTLAWIERVALALDVDISELLAPLDDEAAFTRVTPAPSARFRTALPLCTWASLALGTPPIESDEWVTPKTKRKLRKTQLVARIVGRAMEPLFPAHSYAIFDTQAPEVLSGCVVLAQHPNVSDEETAASYTLRRWRRHEGEITLQPENERARAFTFSSHDARSIVVLAELIELLPRE